MPVNARMHLKIWLTRADGKNSGTAGQELLGQGRVELLRRMAELGSLKKAAESMGMSYRLAWGRLKKMEEALGRPLVESGDNRRGGYSLTPAGEELGGRGAPFRPGARAAIAQYRPGSGRPGRGGR